MWPGQKFTYRPILFIRFWLPLPQGINIWTKTDTWIFVLFTFLCYFRSQMKFFGETGDYAEICKNQSNFFISILFDSHCRWSFLFLSLFFFSSVFCFNQVTCASKFHPIFCVGGIFLHHFAKVELSFLRLGHCLFSYFFFAYYYFKINSRTQNYSRQRAYRSLSYYSFLYRTNI